MHWNKITCSVIQGTSMYISTYCLSTCMRCKNTYFRMNLVLRLIFYTVLANESETATSSSKENLFSPIILRLQNDVVLEKLLSFSFLMLSYFESQSSANTKAAAVIAEAFESQIASISSIFWNSFFLAQLIQNIPVRCWKVNI